MKSSVLMLALLVGCTDDESDKYFTISSDRIELGPVECGTTASSRALRIDNLFDDELVVAIETDSLEIEVQPELVVPAHEAKALPISASIFRRLASGTLVLTGYDRTVKVGVQLHGIGVPVTFDPPVLDFGNVLPSTTKELPLTATLAPDADFSMDLVLRPSSTPRFDIVGPTTARLHTAAPTATFLVRYHSSVQPLTHEGTLPIAVSGGSCTPPELDLIGVTVE